MNFAIAEAGSGGWGAMSLRHSEKTNEPKRNGSVLSLDRIARRFGDVVALHELTLEAKAGEFVSILGPSGSGKTTTLNLIAGFDKPSSGTIRLGECDVTYEAPYARNIGMVFQNYALFPHMTVYENIAFPLRSHGWASQSIRKSVDDALELVQLPHVAQRFPRQLSGGQQQRIALARAIVYRPNLLLMDEPLGALDRKLRSDMQFEIKRLHREIGTTIIYVTHDQDEALSMSDRIAILNGGKLEQYADPRVIYARPATRFVAGFVGESNFLDGVVTTSGAEVKLDALSEPVQPTQLKASAGKRVTLSLRPEGVQLLPCENVGQSDTGLVEEILFLGDAVKTKLRIGDVLLLAKTPFRSFPELCIGERVRVKLNASESTVFAM